MLILRPKIAHTLETPILLQLRCAVQTLADVHVSHQKACSLFFFLGKTQTNGRKEKDLHASNHYQTTHTEQHLMEFIMVIK